MKAKAYSEGGGLAVRFDVPERSRKDDGGKVKVIWMCHPLLVRSW